MYVFERGVHPQYWKNLRQFSILVSDFGILEDKVLNLNITDHAYQVGHGGAKEI